MNKASSHQSAPSAQHRFRTLADALGEANAVTADLASRVISECCWRFRALPQGKHADHIERLIRAHAWTDLALGLIELELPQWQIRRIAYDEGEWHCALSRQRELPDWLDQSIETRHAELSLAILSALVEARWTNASSSDVSAARIPGQDTSLDASICCDNFA